MLGSHNSMSYLPPLRWWMRAIGFTSRCQSKTLEEQYRLGARYFDIRVVCVRGRMTFAHGAVLYKSGLDDFYSIMQKSDVYLRIVHENSFYNGDIEAFEEFIEQVLLLARCRVAYTVTDKKTWKIGERYEGVTEINRYPVYPADGKIPFPRRHAKKYDRPLPSEIMTDEAAYLIDFV